MIPCRSKQRQTVYQVINDCLVREKPYNIIVRNQETSE